MKKTIVFGILTVFLLVSCTQQTYQPTPTQPQVQEKKIYEDCNHQSYWSSNTRPESENECVKAIRENMPGHDWKCTIQTISGLTEDYLIREGYKNEVTCNCCYTYTD